MNHIELFAGCGGLSLGLETSGFELILANELSPMASETFAFNHLGADLETQKGISKVLWISSRYPRSELKSRLRENPYTAAGLSTTHFSDLIDSKPTNSTLRRSLLVGSIIDINTILDSSTEIGKKNGWLLRQLKTGLGDGRVDIVSGGPPCQSFSLAGMRDHSHHRNQLPGEFVKFVSKVKPRIALLENVSGILRPFTIKGKKFYPWFEIAKAFAKEDYIPVCLHINAKNVGTAQNRPRFILIALERNVYGALKKHCGKNDLLVNAIKCSEPLMSAMKNIRHVESLYKNNEISKTQLQKSINEFEPEYGIIDYFDIDKNEDLFRRSFLSPLLSHKNDSDDMAPLVSVKNAIDDLHNQGSEESDYVKQINEIYIRHHDYRCNKFLNHELRKNDARVRARFRVYQILNKIDKIDAKTISDFLRNKASKIPKRALMSLSSNWLLDLNGKKISKPTIEEANAILKKLHTKKQTQKALTADKPAPAALSIPDDACHYHESVEMLRTLTVREMTRIQSFPDWYVIKSKITTGGQMRKFEVPQYTQVGNAVPPLLGIALGNVCKMILQTVDKDKY